MRDLLFRGKSRENGDWYEGNLEINKYYHINSCFVGKIDCTRNTCVDYSSEEKDYRIVDRNCGIDDDGFVYYQSGCDESCDPETIGQFTGKFDKNRKRVFEGDIIRYNSGRECVVEWFDSPSFCGFDLRAINCDGTPPSKYRLWNPDDLEVIGNIHDNPEMLEVEK